jgi:CheY-like chemotaxis protein/signal recognition particle receptor subunit beta
MPVFNPLTNEVTAKIVYYGPGLSGKTTNLAWIHQHVRSKTKGELLSLATEQDRTLFFDFLPLDLGAVRGVRTRLQIYTVPGQVYYESIRSLVLKGADAVVLVCDSQPALLEHNLASFHSLRENIIANGLDPNLPLVMQYNKRDLPNALPLAAMNAAVNPRGLFPVFEAVATEGIGVEETLKGITKWLFESLADLYTSAPTDAPRATELSGTSSVAVAAPAPAAAAVVAPAAAARVSEPPAGDPLPRGADLRPDQWLYLLEGRQRGPLDLDDLIDLVLTSIPEDTKVWRPGFAGWKAATLVTEIAEHIPPPLDFPTDDKEEEFPDFKSVPEILRVALIADEDPAFRRLLGRPLAAQGFKIHEAKDGAEAWTLAIEQRVWLILADPGMAEIDGFEFCRRVRSSSLLKHTPLVFISGSDRYKDRYRALQLGADDFLSKRTPIRELLIRIQLLMTRYSELDKAAPSAGAGGTDGESGALHGRIEVFGAPAVLQIIYQGALSGVFSARRQETGGDAAVFSFRDGQIISASCQDQSGSEAVFAFLTWDRGQFDFIPGEGIAGEPIGNVEYLLFEGCRRLDETRRGDDPGPAGS